MSSDSGMRCEMCFNEVIHLTGVLVMCGGGVGQSVMYLCTECKAKRDLRNAAAPVQEKIPTRMYSVGDLFGAKIISLEVIKVCDETATTTYPYTVKMRAQGSGGVVVSTLRISEFALSEFHVISSKEQKVTEEAMLAAIASDKQIQLFDSSNSPVLLPEDIV